MEQPQTSTSHPTPPPSTLPALNQPLISQHQVSASSPKVIPAHSHALHRPESHPIEWKCQWNGHCRQQFDNELELYNHSTDHVKNGKLHVSNGKVTDVSQMKCTWLMTAAEAIEAKGSLGVAGICGREFRHRGHLKVSVHNCLTIVKDHIRSHFSKDLKFIECPDCPGVSFRNRQQLWRHRKRDCPGVVAENVKEAAEAVAMKELRDSGVPIVDTNALIHPKIVPPVNSVPPTGTIMGVSITPAKRPAEVLLQQQPRQGYPLDRPQPQVTHQPLASQPHLARHPPQLQHIMREYRYPSLILTSQVQDLLLRS
jgi:hypothetical protein